MIKNDIWIKEQGVSMINPFEGTLVREKGTQKCISYGLSSYGYDIRLSPIDFQVFKHLPGNIIDPKNFNPKTLERAELQRDKYGSYFILPGNSYGLGVSLEHITMVPNVTAICMGKSTYARCGIIVNVTPLEAGWEGHITIEFSNSSNADARIYANEGVLQLLFFEGEICETTYSDRQGKYQNQSHQIVLPKV